MDPKTIRRIGKACDRCRIKKVRCDGDSPCERCSTDNAVCHFGERFPKRCTSSGYVGHLEYQRIVLAHTLMRAYEKWAPPEVKKSYTSTPTIHSIVDILGIKEDISGCDFDGLSKDLNIEAPSDDPTDEPEENEPPNEAVDDRDAVFVANEEDVLAATTRPAKRSWSDYHHNSNSAEPQVQKSWDNRFQYLDTSTSTMMELVDYSQSPPSATYSQGSPYFPMDAFASSTAYMMYNTDYVLACSGRGQPDYLTDSGNDSGSNSGSNSNGDSQDGKVPIFARRGSNTIGLSLDLEKRDVPNNLRNINDPRNWQYLVNRYQS